MNKSENKKINKMVQFSDTITIFTFEKDNICIQEYLEQHFKCLTEHLKACYFQKFRTLHNFDIHKELVRHSIQQLIDEIELEKDPMYCKKEVIYNSEEETSSDEEHTFSASGGLRDIIPSSGELNTIR